MKVWKIVAGSVSAILVIGVGIFVQANWIFLRPDCQSSSTPVFGYEIVNTYPHDETSFTEGLVYENGTLYESTGIYGISSLRKFTLTSGNILQNIPLDKAYFAEGLTLMDNQLVQLTWQEKKAFVYDKTSLQQVSEFSYPMEGWGLTHDANHFILSNGSPTIFFLDKKNFSVVREITVTDGTCSVYLLNELEYIQNEIYANLLGKNRIARISPETGKVLSWIDLTGLRPTDLPDPANRIPNGIAYDPATNRLFVTGKWWPKLYEIRLVEKKQ